MPALKTNVVHRPARYAGGPSTHDILTSDRNPAATLLREESFVPDDSEDIPVDRYISQAWFDLEVEHVWKKSWQVVGRLEDIPDIGDYIVYDIIAFSLIVVRTDIDTIRAYHNFCLHRGRKLKTDPGSGNATEIKCPFHGFSWKLDGNIKNVPCQWDFRHMSEEDLRLREAKVGSWGGFIFVNMDPQCEELESFLGSLPEHFKDWALQDRYKSAHVRKRIACNWKVGMEAFLEGYHAATTHPQMMPYLADVNSQYDTYEGENFNRMINPLGVHSPQISPLSDDEIVAKVMGSFSAFKNSSEKLADGVTARSFLADLQRKICAAQTGLDQSSLSDSEMLDIIQYFVFPNFFPWGGFLLNTLIYVFRPDGNNPNSCILDVMELRRRDPSTPMPKGVPVHVLSDDEKWADAPELRGNGPVFDQDMANMPYVQLGMKASKMTKAAISLANYQESRIRDLHRMLDKRIFGGRDAR